MATINENIESLNTYINQIDEKLNSLNDKLSPENKQIATNIANKTKDTILKSIAKLEELKASVSDESTIEEFLVKLDTRCKEISEYTIEKLDTLKPTLNETLNEFVENLKEPADEFKKEVKDKGSDIEFKLNDTYNRLINNPNVVNATNMVKAGVEKAKEFYYAEETQDFINTMKIKTINIAEKGLEELKILLDRADKNDEE